MLSPSPQDWSITIDAPDILAVAVYLRDTAGLAPKLDLPRAEPTVPQRHHGGDTASGQWREWWGGEISRLPYRREQVALQPDSSEFLTRFPELAQLAAQSLGAARDWAAQQGTDRSVIDQPERGLVETELVQDRTTAAGLHRPPPFHLTLVLVPVTGRYFEKINNAGALVATRLFAFIPFYRAALSPLIDELLQIG